MKKLLAIILCMVAISANAQNLREWSSKGAINTLRGKWYYDSSKTYVVGDSLRLVFWKQLLDTAAAIRTTIAGGGSAYTFSTGLTNTTSTITNNVLTGVSGGQTWIGGTASGDDIILKSTSHSTRGDVRIEVSPSLDIRFDLNGGVPRLGGNDRLQLEAFTGSGTQIEVVNEQTFTGTTVFGVRTTSLVPSTSNMFQVTATSNNPALMIKGDSRITFNSNTPATELFYFNGKARFDSTLTLRRVPSATPLNILGRLADSSVVAITMADLATALGASSNYIKTDGATTMAANSTVSMSTFNLTLSNNSSGRFKLNGIKSDDAVRGLGMAADSSVVGYTIQTREEVDVNTSNATPTTVFTLTPDVGTEEVITIVITFNAKKLSATGGYVAMKKMSFMWDGVTTLTNGTLADIVAEQFFSGLSTCDITITNSGDDIIVQFTGEGSTNIHGTLYVDITRTSIGL